MPTVHFTPALQRFFPNLEAAFFQGTTIAELLNQIEQKYPSIQDYILDEEGKLRKHINIFIAEKMIEDRATLTDQVKASDEVLIFQALSGG